MITCLDDSEILRVTNYYYPNLTQNPLLSTLLAEQNVGTASHDSKSPGCHPESRGQSRWSQPGGHISRFHPAASENSSESWGQFT